MRYKNFASAGPWTALANLLDLQGHRAEDRDIVLGAGLHAMLIQQEETGAYRMGVSLQGPQWYNLYLRPRGWEYMEFAYPKEDAIDFLWPLTMLRLEKPNAMPVDAVYLGDVDEVYSFIPSVSEAADVDRLEMSREELMDYLPEQVKLGSIRRCGAKEIDRKPLWEASMANWARLREEICAFMAQEHMPSEIRDALDRIFSAPLHAGQTIMRMLGREEDAKRLEVLHHQVMRAVTSGKTLRLADVMRTEEVLEAIRMLSALTEKEMQGE